VASYTYDHHTVKTDFSVVLFRSGFVLFSEKNYVKALKNQ